MPAPTYRAPDVPLAPLAAGLYTQGRATREAANAAERAMTRTVSLAGSFLDGPFLNAVMAEVKRRTEHMSEAHAWDSVGDDIAAGRWHP